MTDDPDLLTVAGNAATDLLTNHRGEVADHLRPMRVVPLGPGMNEHRHLPGELTYLQVRDKIADALGFHLAGLKRELAEADERAAANGARAAEAKKLLDEYHAKCEELLALAALLRPFAAAYDARAREMPHVARLPDDVTQAIPAPVGAWRAAHRALNPAEGPGGC